MFLRRCSDYINPHVYNVLHAAPVIYVPFRFEWVILRTTIDYRYTN